jgi:hypothetical protein
MTKETKGNSNDSTPKRGAFPTPRSALADATPYEPERRDQSGADEAGAATGVQLGPGNMGTPGTPPPPSGSTGAGSQSGAGIGTPGTPPPPSGSTRSGSHRGSGNKGTPGTPPPPN